MYNAKHLANFIKTPRLKLPCFSREIQSRPRELDQKFTLKKDLTFSLKCCIITTVTD